MIVPARKFQIRSLPFGINTYTAKPLSIQYRMFYINNNTFYFSDKYMYDMIKRDIYDSYTDVIDGLFGKCNISERIGNSPVRVSGQLEIDTFDFVIFS